MTSHRENRWRKEAFILADPSGSGRPASGSHITDHQLEIAVPLDGPISFDMILRGPDYDLEKSLKGEGVWMSIFSSRWGDTEGFSESRLGESSCPIVLLSYELSSRSSDPSCTIYYATYTRL